MYKSDFFSTLNIGDKIINNTSNTVFTVKGFYDNKYGAILVDSDGNSQKISRDNINTYYTIASKYDNVNNPQHYTSGGIECIDAMIAAYGKEAVANFCKCNAFKYTFRSDKKQPILSIEKAQWYLNKYMELAPEFNEEWRPHPNGLYEVSSLGNIRRVDADKNRKKITLKNGYDTVMFSVEGKVTCQYVHRLVAEVFIPNPLGLPQVNHINHIRTDNRVENLEWCDNKYNVQDAKSTKLYVYNTDGDFIGDFNSIRDCEQFFSFGHNSIDTYIDTGMQRGNLVFYTKKISIEDLKKAVWYNNKYI